MASKKRTIELCFSNSADRKLRRAGMVASALSQARNEEAETMHQKEKE